MDSVTPAIRNIKFQNLQCWDLDFRHQHRKKKKWGLSKHLGLHFLEVARFVLLWTIGSRIPFFTSCDEEVRNICMFMRILNWPATELMSHLIVFFFRIQQEERGSHSAGHSASLNLWRKSVWLQPNLDCHTNTYECITSIIDLIQHKSTALLPYECTTTVTISIQRTNSAFECCQHSEQPDIFKVFQNKIWKRISKNGELRFMSRLSVLIRMDVSNRVRLLSVTFAFCAQWVISSGRHLRFPWVKGKLRKRIKLVAQERH